MPARDERPEDSQQQSTATAVANPFGSAPAERGAGAMIQADRAQQEIQAAMTVAAAKPRDPMRAMDRIIQDCTRTSVAEIGLYAYPKGGETVSGPSIRLAEIVAQRWGNMWFGVTELQQDHDKTVAMAYAWDLETNARDERTFTVPHKRHTRRGSYRVEDPREIYEMVANMGARRKRAAIQAVVPREVFDAASAQVEKTLAQTADVEPESIRKMVEAFSEYGVSEDQLVRYIGHRLDSMITAEMVRLKKVYASIRDGFAAPADFFGQPEPSGDGDEGGSQPASGAERFKKKAAAKKKAASKKKAAAAQDATATPQGGPDGTSPDGGGSTGSPDNADTGAQGGESAGGSGGFDLEAPGETDWVSDTITRMEGAQERDTLDEIADEALNGTEIDDDQRQRLLAAHKRNSERLGMFSGD